MTAEDILDAGPIRWCVYRMEIGRNRMTVHARRELNPDPPFQFQHSYDHGPYKNDRRMYLVDNNGKRYDTVATTGGMRDGGKLWALNRLEGTFVFPAPAPGARAFVFHDDDLMLGLEGLQPKARNKIDARRQATLRVVLGSADHLVLKFDQGQFQVGLTLSVEKRPSKKWTGEGVHFDNRGSFPLPVELEAAVVATYLDEMAATPLIERDPRQDVTPSDRSSSMSFEIAAGKQSVTFQTEGAGFYDLSPWIVTLEGKSYLGATPIPVLAIVRFMTNVDISKYFSAPGHHHGASVLPD